MARFELDKGMIRELAGLLDETGLSEIEIEMGGKRIRVAKGGGTTTIAAPAIIAPPSPGAALGAPGATVDASHPGAITSPMVGTVFLQPEPGAPVFVAAGDEVKPGQTLFIIEAMKTMNPVVADRAGRVQRIAVSNGQPVEFGDVLLILE